MNASASAACVSTSVRSFASTTGFKRAPVTAGLLLAAAAMGLGYGAWNISILAGAAYATPVLSAALSSLLLRAPLSTAFWQGAPGQWLTGRHRSKSMAILLSLFCSPIICLI